MNQYIFEVKHADKVENATIITNEPLSAAYRKVASQFDNIRNIKLESELKLDGTFFYDRKEYEVKT